MEYGVANIPPNLTLNQARVIEYFYREGAKNPENKHRTVNYLTMVDHMQRTYGFAAYSDFSDVAFVNQPRLLEPDPRAAATHRTTNDYRVVQGIHDDPTPLYEALNRLEAAAGVELTQRPAVVPAIDTKHQKLGPGDVVKTSDGEMCYVEVVDGRPVLRRLAVMEQDAPSRGRPDGKAEPAAVGRAARRGR